MDPKGPGDGGAIRRVGAEGRGCRGPAEVVGPRVKDEARVAEVEMVTEIRGGPFIFRCSPLRRGGPDVMAAPPPTRSAKYLALP